MAPASSNPVVLESVWRGEALTTRVGPAVVQGGYTVVRLDISADSGERFSLGSSMFGAGVDNNTMAAVRMILLRDKVAFLDVQSYVDGIARAVDAGSSLELFAVFGGLPKGTESVDVFLPNVGVALGVPVVDAASAGFDVDAALADAEIDESIESVPLELNSLVVVADGSSDTEKDDASTTVNVSGDVLLATDSADLSSEADGVLSTVVQQLELYPSGGTLGIVGHTDDVNTDEHNQGLSERRAKAVSDRLGELTDLSGWETTVSGKGESEPRVANDSDENRQLNRRVEILLTPTDPSEAAAGTAGGGTSSSSGEMPDATGPVGRGPEGVDIDIDGVPARISLDSVTRTGKFLVGAVKIEAEQDVKVPTSFLRLPVDLRLTHMWTTFSTTGFTLLSGNQRYLVCDVQFKDGEYLQMVSLGRVPPLTAGNASSFPAVWPDTGGESVVLDLIGGRDAYSEMLTVRLTDIPVIDG